MFGSRVFKLDMEKKTLRDLDWSVWYQVNGNIMLSKLFYEMRLLRSLRTLKSLILLRSLRLLRLLMAGKLSSF